MENKAQDAAYPGKVILTYPSVIDYASSQVRRCKKIFNIALVGRFSEKRHSKSFRGVSEGFYEGEPPTSFQGHPESRLVDMPAKLLFEKPLDHILDDIRINCIRFINS